MLRGFYISANGILNQQRIIETISNNISNSQTAGYKADTVIPTTFDERLLLIKGQKNKTGTIEYRTIDYLSTSLEQGSFNQTGRRLDMALKGNVFFNIQPTNNLYADEGETLLTRNGQFSIDDEGYLVLEGAGRVMGKDGPIQIGTADFTVDETGLIVTDDGQAYQLALTYVPAGTDVVKKGDNLFALSENAEGAGEIPEGTDYAVLQGAYERSNVDVTHETTAAIAAQSNFTSCSQMLKIFDAINQKTAMEIGRV